MMEPVVEMSKLMALPSMINACEGIAALGMWCASFA